MPRTARLDAPGVLHHVIIRGIERRKIFWDNRDRDNLVERLGGLLQETGTACYSWALLPNHAHFLFRTGKVSLASLMGRLLTGYVVTFNRRHRRHGQLFQNRYKSIVCQEELYFKELVRYIHLNPLRAGVVPTLARLNTYPYSGHSAVLGKRERPWEEVKYVLHSFSDRPRDARTEYLAFVKAGVGQGRREDLVGGGLIRSVGGWAEVKKLRRKGREHLKSDERILGDSEFVNTILSAAQEQLERRSALSRRGYDLDRVAEKVARIYRMKKQEILGAGRERRRVEARSLFCYWAVRELGTTLTALAKRLEMSPPGVGYAVQRGEAIAREHGFRLRGK